MKIKFYSPIFPKMVYCGEEYDEENWCDDIDAAEAAKYDIDIGREIEIEMNRETEFNMSDTEKGGLAKYLWTAESEELENSPQEKVTDCHPTIANLDGRLYGVMEIEVTEALSEEETKALKEYCAGQYSDGWGEVFEQRPIRTENGDLYVSFWKANDFYIETEENFAKRIGIPLEQLTEQKTYREEISDTGISMGF